MSSFHVFVEGAVEPGDVALERLATAMAARYGLPAADLIARMKRGRFRVKANIDRATAETYANDLTAIGARTTVEAARLQSSPSIPVQNVQPAEPPVRNSAPQFQSGLSAAFAPSDAKMDLGALGGDNQAFSLASIDGETVAPATPPPAARFTPPPAASAPASPKAPRPPPSSNEPLDMFAPPGGDEAELAVELAPDEIDYRARKASIPPATVPVDRQSAPAIRPSAEVFVASPGPNNDGFVLKRRAHMVIGVLLAIGIGFVPATIVASVRERAAFKEIDARVIASQNAAGTETELAQLDDMRATELANKRSSRRNIALIAMLIWAAAGAGVGYVWFRRVPWDRR